MFIAMNRFRVLAENANAFEALWLNRDSQLKGLEGFVSFNMLKGPEADGVILYASHTTWAREEDFIAWTKSEAFRLAHKDAGTTKALYEGPPAFEGFSAIQSISGS